MFVFAVLLEDLRCEDLHSKLAAHLCVGQAAQRFELRLLQRLRRPIQRPVESGAEHRVQAEAGQQQHGAGEAVPVQQRPHQLRHQHLAQAGADQREAHGATPAR